MYIVGFEKDDVAYQVVAGDVETVLVLVSTLHSGGCQEVSIYEPLGEEYMDIAGQTLVVLQSDALEEEEADG